MTREGPLAQELQKVDIFKMKNFIFLTLSVLLGINALAASDLYELKTIAVQENGRLKPLDSFSREALQLIYGRQTFAKEDAPGGKLTAIDVVMIWLIQPTAWENSPIFEIAYSELKTSLKLPVERKHFSYSEILGSERLPTLMQELQSRREAKEKLDPFFQAVQRMESQLFTFREIVNGNLLHILPPTEGTSWVTVSQFQEASQQAAFAKIVQAFTGYAVELAKGGDADSIRTAKQQIDTAAKEFKEMARKVNPDLYPSETRMKIELHYQEFHPFQVAWIFYLTGAVICFLAWILRKDSLYIPAWVGVLVGFLLHIYGFALRIYISGRAPVSNMYETVVWVGLGAVIFSMIIEATYRWRFILMAGALVGTFCLALADMAPVILDPSLQPLEPVLRNNFWLLIHVLTITISYAAFFLAFALGDIGLFYFLFGEEKNQDKIKAISLAIYRSIQIGVALLGPGIILGGIWADYSWGRFWGWDPKETWALIALLGYLAVLHGRMGGWIKDFGMNACAVVTFSLVIMAWYGVNFILGAGLHSYGFGAGGVEYVSVFVALHICLVVFATVFRKSKTLNKK